MGMMSQLLETLFGAKRNVVAETVGIFRENAENRAEREAAFGQAALSQFAAEFAHPRRSLFDTVIDGLNRVPRPAMAIGTLGLFISAMVDPVWFASRMQGVALVPEPLWWLLGAIVGFYFGARHQVKGQEFQRSIAETLARTGQVADGIAAFEALRAGSGEPIDVNSAATVIEAEVAETGPIVGAGSVPVDDATDPIASAARPVIPSGGAKRFPNNAALAEWSDAHS